MALVESTLEFDVKSQADDLFKDFMKAIKDYDEVEIKAEDWEKREITINVTSSDFFTKYKTFKLTATITPRDDGDGSRVKWTGKIEKIPDDIHVDPHIHVTPSEDGDGSHVKWTVVLEKISDGIDDPYLAINTTAYLIQMLDGRILK
ncbi:PREDICTED: uncharacterized protein At1g24000-like [Camelina sativa]|uniref:Uncharacterized protein At1g24000-like n=1 Tax=Camelina sativa TaxID=90675 RepID=A0ABM0WV01_CAMSA|nr:PREDICTED: uncharacterized protein At1g24000-like [Camelina sativa]